jgi:hypothetical protein
VAVSRIAVRVWPYVIARSVACIASHTAVLYGSTATRGLQSNTVRLHSQPYASHGPTAVGQYAVLVRAAPVRGGWSMVVLAGSSGSSTGSQAAAGSAQCSAGAARHAQARRHRPRTPRPATLRLLDREAETLHTHQHRPVCGTDRDPGSLARIEKRRATESPSLAGWVGLTTRTADHRPGDCVPRQPKRRRRGW